MTVNSVLCTKCDQYGRCSKLKKITPTAERLFVFGKYDKVNNGMGEVQQEVMCDEAETVKEFCYLGDSLNACGGCEAAVTARQEWDGRNSECGEILLVKRFSLWMKEVYKNYVRSAMLYGSKMRCLRENEVAILRRAKRCMMRAIWSCFETI